MGTTTTAAISRTKTTVLEIWEQSFRVKLVLSAMNKKRNVRQHFYTSMSVVVLLVSLIMVMLFNGCRESNAPQANSAASKSANTSPTPQSAFERDLQYARSSQNFTKVYVFARKDGNTIESADGDLLKAKAPADPHIWWVLTDEKRRVIMCTYSDFAPQKLNSLREHFNVEDYTDR